MKTKKVKVDVFLESLLCDKCSGDMNHTGSMLTSNPPQFEYKCSACGEMARSFKLYPFLTYVENKSVE